MPYSGLGLPENLNDYLLRHDPFPFKLRCRAFLGAVGGEVFGGFLIQSAESFFNDLFFEPTWMILPLFWH